MIITKLMGGMGNQMFQYAIARHIAIKHNTSVVLDLSFLNNRPLNADYTFRNYELDIFNIKARIANNNDFKFIKPSYYNILKYKLLNKPIPYYKQHIITQKDIHFDKNILTAPNNVLLNGYWQSEKYFKNIEETIKEDFTITEPLDVKNNEVLYNIITTNSVAIHFRRGDYVSNKSTKATHGICDLKYYYEAVDCIKQKVTNPFFYIFSDDIEWVIENFKLNNNIIYIDKEKKNKSFHDMKLMSSCKHFIIANSSYSWWAAWLGYYCNKIVIAPKKWFNILSKNTQDLYVDKWIKI